MNIFVVFDTKEWVNILRRKILFEPSKAGTILHRYQIKKICLGGGRRKVMIVLRPQPPQKYHIHNECYGNSKLDSCIIIRVGLESFIIDSNFFCSQPRTPTANKMSGQAAQIKNLCQIFIFSTHFCASNVFMFYKFLCFTKQNFIRYL